MTTGAGKSSSPGRMKIFTEEEKAEFRRRYLNEKLTDARRKYLEIILEVNNELAK